MAVSRCSLAGSVRRVSSKFEAWGLGVAEQALDRPAFAVGGERVVARAVGGDNDPFAVRRFEGGEMQGPGHAVERGGAAPPAPVVGDLGGKLHPAAVGAGHKAAQGQSGW